MKMTINTQKSAFSLSLLLVLGVSAISIGGAQARVQIALPDAVESNSIRADAFSTGTLNAREGALPSTLWQGSQEETLEFLLDNSPSRPALPAIGDALRRTLLSPSSDEESRSNQELTALGGGVSEETQPSPLSPQNLTPLDVVSANAPPLNVARQNLGGKKLLALVNAGFIAEAQTIASLSDAPQGDPFVGKALALADLLNRNENQACQRGAALNSQRSDPFWLKLRAFCYVVAGERDAADLTMSLLRDQGSIDAEDDDFLTAFITGAEPKKPLSPKSALQLAVMRQLNMPIVPLWVKGADGAVIKSVAQDEALDLSTRIEVTKYALAMGIMTLADYANLLKSVPLELEQFNQAEQLLAQQSNDVLLDAIIYQSVQSMIAPEFLKDKAALIANHLQSANGFEHAYALNVLYAADIDRLQGAIISPAHAGLYAKSRMAVGDSEGAGRWLLAMKGEEPITSLGDEMTREFMELTGLLTLLDPVVGTYVANSANIEVPDLSAVQATQIKQFEPSQEILSADIAQAVFDAAMGNVTQGNDNQERQGLKKRGPKKRGQAALAAIALTDITLSNRMLAEVTPLHNVVSNQAFQIAGLNDVRRAIDFQSAWKIVAEQSSKRARQKRPQGPVVQDDGFTPSLKPRGTKG